MNFLNALRARLGFSRSVAELESVAAYALWADSYPPVAHNRLMQVEEAAVRELLPVVVGQCVLDLGSGTGRYGRILRNAGAVSIVGIDNSRAMLERNPLGMRILGEVEALPLPNSCVDGVLCGLTLGHVPDITGPFAEISRVMRPGGWFILSDFHPYLAAIGMQRTFRTAGGALFAVKHHVHERAAYIEAARQSGLTVERILEPVVVPPGRKKAVPAVLVMALRKG